MRKADKLKKGDTVAIVSLSNGLLNQEFQIKKLEKNLKEIGLNVIYPQNAKKSFEELKGDSGAKLRAEDLKELFKNPNIKAIFTAIGGDDTYRTIPYLMEDKEFIKNVKKNPKIFSGFSDTTINHLMFYKLGLNTFYGPNGLNDLAELGPSLLPYTKDALMHYFNGFNDYEITSSKFWYEERTDFSEKSLNIPRVIHNELNGYEILQGSGKVKGKLIGGCIESLSDMLVSESYDDQVKICNNYHIFPSKRDWKNKIIFLENSSDFASENKLRKMLETLAVKGIFDKAKAVILGKPQNNFKYNEYKQVYIKFFSNLKNKKLKVVYNLNFGHSYPRCIIPYNSKAELDLENKKLKICQKILK